MNKEPITHPMSYNNSTEIVPENKTGLEDCKFVSPFPNTIYVYYRTTFDSPLSKKQITDWLCCTEGWKLKDDGKWHETVSCGWKPDRIADTLEELFNYYRHPASTEAREKEAVGNDATASEFVEKLLDISPDRLMEQEVEYGFA